MFDLLPEFILASQIFCLAAQAKTLNNKAATNIFFDFFVARTTLFNHDR